MGRTGNHEAGWTREGVKRRLVARQWLRFQMSLILMTAGLPAMLAIWVLLQAGVGAMLVRYPIAVAVVFGTFPFGVWLLLRYAGVVDGGDAGEEKPGNSLLEGGALPDILSEAASGALPPGGPARRSKH